MVTKKGKSVVTTDPNTTPANTPPAETFEASGAPAQDASPIDPSHPAVDANPRDRTTDQQNRIDFNDPTLSGSEAVAKALGQKA